MRFTESPLSGVFIVDVEAHLDERGSFTRTFCENEFAEYGLSAQFVQCSVSSNPVAGTLRGLHYQDAPEQETKLVRCTQGAIYDVAVDLRENSKTYCKWFSAELSQKNQRAMFIPEGYAHGFITLSPNSEIFYQMGSPYNGQLARGVRWNDPAFSIDWPSKPVCISDRDASFPLVAFRLP